MLTRRDFFKVLTVCSLPDEKSIPANNILEYVDCEISFPFAKEDDIYSLQIYQHTMTMIQSMVENPKETVLIQMGTHDNTLYDHRIDELLCQLNICGIYDYLTYPKIKFFYKEQEIKTPNISLVCYFENPVFYFSRNQQVSIKPSIDKLFTHYLNNPCYPLDELIIHMTVDLHYYDITRPNIVFDIRSFAQ